MLAEKILSINWVWSLDSVVNYELSHSAGHTNPIVAQPPYLERLSSWNIVRPARADLNRPDVPLPMFENVYQYNVDEIMFDMFEYCEHETYPVPDIKTAVSIANKKFKKMNMRKVANVVTSKALEPEGILQGLNIQVSPHCPQDRIYVLTHKDDVGAMAKNGIKFGMGIWHPNTCVVFSVIPGPINSLLDLMMALDK